MPLSTNHFHANQSKPDGTTETMYITIELKYTAVVENTYYHFTVRCVQRKHPSFQPSQLEIQRDLLLTVAHLMGEFGITHLYYSILHCTHPSKLHLYSQYNSYIHYVVLAKIVLTRLLAHWNINSWHFLCSITD